MSKYLAEESRDRLELGNNESEFLIVSVLGQPFAINVSKVLNISIWDEQLLTVIPGSNSISLGTVLFRDQHIAAVDLGCYLFNRIALETDQQRLLIATHFNAKTLGFIVDAVDGIERISWRDFVPYEGEFDSASSSKINGTITIKERIVLVPDLEGIASELDPSISIESFEDQVEKLEIEENQIPRILYCEDSKIVQKVTVKSLEKAGFKDITLCGTGAEGLDLIKQRINRPDQFQLIISDIEMPKMDGLTLCRETKSIPSMAKVPFLFFSSLINDQMKHECARVGGQGAHSKPEIHNMVDAIRKIFNF